MLFAQSLKDRAPGVDLDGLADLFLRPAWISDENIIRRESLERGLLLPMKLSYYRAINDR